MDDLISRSAFRAQLSALIQYDNSQVVDYPAYNTAIIDAKAELSAAPTIDPESLRARGKWIRLDMHKGMEQHKCSVCGSACYVPECMGEPLYEYCPNCGAKMEV